jgi:hypothetical protein
VIGAYDVKDGGPIVVLQALLREFGIDTGLNFGFKKYNGCVLLGFSSLKNLFEIGHMTCLG